MPKVLSDAEIADFRERLIDAAERLFAEKGLEAVSLRQLAAELNVSAMTPYRYFKDKDDMLAAVRARGFDQFAADLEEAFTQPGPIEQRVTAVGEAYLAFAFAHPAAYGLMFDVSQPSEADHPDLMRAEARARRTMTDYMDLMVGAGLAEGDTRLLAHAFWAAIHGLVVLKLGGKFAPEVSFDAVRHTLFAALGRGIRPQPGS